MKFVEVKELPRKMYNYNLQNRLMEFMKMNVKIVEVVFNEREYKNQKACYTAFYNAVKRGAFPVDVKTQEGKVYLVRRDL